MEHIQDCPKGGRLSMAERILVIEDDCAYAEMLRAGLERIGYKVDLAYNATEGLRRAFQNRPDLVILDIMMPGIDGWQVCQRFREMSDIPILMLTALASEDHKIKGLDLGADEYLVKPVTMEVLAAHIRALLRRAANSDSTLETVYEAQGLTIDIEKRAVTRDGKRIDLSPTEFRLLECLVRNKGRSLSHEFLLNEVWGPAVEETRYLKLYISYLRHKIEVDPSEPKLILTEWGYGYLFNG
jgi:two-component system KDP operon response regulator KdpE